MRDVVTVRGAPAERRRAVLVTGGARRIGRAICEELADCGWMVVVHARDAADADAHALARRLGGVAVFQDLAEPGAADRLMDDSVRLAPDLCAIVNNASVFSTAATLPPESARWMRTVNVDVPAHLTALLGNHLRRRGDGARGSVVHLLDARIMRGAACDDTPYAASKRALLEEMRLAALREAPVLRVNGVAPGAVLAPADPANREKGGTPILGRRPTPKDVACAVAFLLSADAITGQTLVVGM